MVQSRRAFALCRLAGRRQPRHERRTTFAVPVGPRVPRKGPRRGRALVVVGSRADGRRCAAEDPHRDRLPQQARAAGAPGSARPVCVAFPSGAPEEAEGLGGGGGGDGGWRLAIGTSSSLFPSTRRLRAGTGSDFRASGGVAPRGPCLPQRPLQSLSRSSRTWPRDACPPSAAHSEPR